MKDSNKKKARPEGVCPRLPDEVKDNLVVWVNDLRKEGVPISHSMLRLEALALSITRAYSWGAILMRAPDRSVMAKWIREEWDALSSDLIARGYNKCYRNLCDKSDVVAAAFIACLEQQCVLDREVGEVESDDDIHT
ncbi:LOW QUALITY PROTEIN: Hypothetical protein PHPALM_3528 [Phytophthora palmivora]|uniref:HTH CENPB-type domain-containing protein n=1 Tax=Phytophthora palmivora TaxID=4796 RepID=A0A2P4YM59_9STRA|nr:LOW QUALITY PROTEIN: Hypothetical protein PHPALM_3528 [Phytophthora palmivora]